MIIITTWLLLLFTFVASIFVSLLLSSFPFLVCVCVFACGSILENLQELKDKWWGCKDPEKDITEKMWRLVFCLLCD